LLTRRSLLTLAVGGLAAAVSAAVYPFAEALGRPRVTSYRLTPQRWPTGLSLRICILADFHACRPWMTGERIAGICDQAQALDADLILLLGDYLPGVRLMTDPISTAEWARPLGRLSAPLGVHAVLGNHDYWEDEAVQNNPGTESFVAHALSEVGVSVLINRAIRVEKDGRHIWLAGLGDQLALLPGKRYERAVGAGLDDLDATLSMVTDDAPVLLMAHEPDIFLAPDPRVDLTFSGHTHGGQLNLFGWRPFSASRGSEIYPAGSYRRDGKDLIVSRGLGCSSLPLRIGSPPEILSIELG
jgi:predicted MPP superfamily phosphohydrolase